MPRQSTKKIKLPGCFHGNPMWEQLEMSLVMAYAARDVAMGITKGADAALKRATADLHSIAGGAASRANKSTKTTELNRRIIQAVFARGLEIIVSADTTKKGAAS